jgi:uncharacterized protein
VEVKFNEAPKITKSMRVVLQDLSLDHLRVMYPGETRYAVDDRITVVPLREIFEIPFS